MWIEGEVLRLIRLRTVSAAVAGRAPGPEASVRKALADDHGQRVMELAKALAGTFGLLADAGPAEGLAHAGGGGPRGTDPADAGPGWPASVWAKGYLFSRALTIGGGTAEVQRNIIAERVLGLPHDIDVEGARPWAQSPASLSPEPGTADCLVGRPHGACHHAPDQGGEGVGMAQLRAVGRAGDLDDLGVGDELDQGVDGAPVVPDRLAAPSEHQGDAQLGHVEGGDRAGAGRRARPRGRARRRGGRRGPGRVSRSQPASPTTRRKNPSAKVAGSSSAMLDALRRGHHGAQGRGGS